MTSLRQTWARFRAWLWPRPRLIVAALFYLTVFPFLLAAIFDTPDDADDPQTRMTAQAAADDSDPEAADTDNEAGEEGEEGEESEEDEESDGLSRGFGIAAVVSWLAFTLAVGLLARLKRRRAVAWGAVAFVTGPLFLPLIIAAPDLTPDHGLSHTD